MVIVTVNIINITSYTPTRPPDPNKQKAHLSVLACINVHTEYYIYIYIDYIKQLYVIFYN